MQPLTDFMTGLYPSYGPSLSNNLPILQKYASQDRLQKLRRPEGCPAGWLGPLLPLRKLFSKFSYEEEFSYQRLGT